MEKDYDTDKTDAEIQQEIIDKYLTENRGHDLSYHYAFTLVSISNFLHSCDYHNYTIPGDVQDRLFRMLMKLIPVDWEFIKSMSAEAERGGVRLN